VAVDPSRAGALYASALLGVGGVASGDDGATWQAANRGLSGFVNAMAASPAAPATLYAATPHGLGASGDGAARWSLHPIPFLPVAPLLADPGDAATVYDAGSVSAGTALATSISPPAPQTLYVATLLEQPSFANALFVSHDGGASFDELSTPGVISFVAADPVDPDTLYCGPGRTGLYKSTDGGRTLTPLQPPAAPGVGITAVAIDPANPALV
jgi:hypothetical protein